MAIAPKEDLIFGEFWDPNNGSTYSGVTDAWPPVSSETYTSVFNKLIARVDYLENRIKQLEEAYMEDKLLGKADTLVK